MNTPILETERLRLRPFRAEDAQAVFDCWASDPEVAKYMFWISQRDVSETEEWLKTELSKLSSDTWFRWAVEDRLTAELYGTALVYFEPAYGEFEIGYNLGWKHWGRGYATEAMRAVVDFAKNTLKVRELVARCAKENPASENVMKKLGFEYCKDIPYWASEDTVLYEGVEYRLRLPAEGNK